MGSQTNNERKAGISSIEKEVLRDGAEDWGEVELYLRQHGHLPKDEAMVKEKPLVISKALDEMAKHLVGPGREAPGPFTTSQVLHCIAIKMKRFEGLKDLIDNPSSWEHFDQSVSDKLKEALGIH